MNKSPFLFNEILPFAAAFLVFVCLFDWDSINSYEAYNTMSTTYERGRVISIESQTLEKYEYDEQLMLGEQELIVTLLTGEKKGESISLTNYLTKTHSIEVSEGSLIIVCVDAPEAADPYYTVFGYDRTMPLLALIAAFAAAVLVVGRTRRLQPRRRNMIFPGKSSHSIIPFIRLQVMRLRIPSSAAVNSWSRFLRNSTSMWC